MGKPDDNGIQLFRVLDNVADSIDEATEEELLEDIHQRGEDPEKYLAKFQKIVDCAVKKHVQK